MMAQDSAGWLQNRAWELGTLNPKQKPSTSTRRIGTLLCEANAAEAKGLGFGVHGLGVKVQVLGFQV